MRLLITTEQRFARTPDGVVWAPGVYCYPFWERYLEVFDQIVVIARVRETPAPPELWGMSSGPDVSFFTMPYYIGPSQFVRCAPRIHAAMGRVLDPQAAVILRLGSQLANVLAPKLWRVGQPYGVEVVGDPYDVFSPGAVQHPLRPIFRWWLTRQLRAQCGRSAGAAYVTREALQRRYPAPTGAFVTHYSDIELGDDDYVSMPRTIAPSAPYSLVTVGSLEQMYKAVDVQIVAVQTCVARGLDLRLTVIGDGRYRSRLEKMAVGLGVANRVRFVGHLPGSDAVRPFLDAADLFLLPSRTEGLPRAMVEAMARALPCIGSRVGGIPELLPDVDLVIPGDSENLAHLIEAVLTDPVRMSAMSACNLETAQDYQVEVLRPRRRALYEEIKKRTAEWRSPTKSRRTSSTRIG